MITGTVKFFNPTKKFGFITPDDGGKDLYLPAGAVAAAGIAKLKTDQRVSFDREADPKGDKAANLKLLEEKLVDAPIARQSLAIYCDPAAPESHAVEAAVRAGGHEPVLIDYLATPLTVDQLKQLALLLGSAGQSLVRRYHPMFLELRLDDRFIGEGEYWTAVIEHPTLINGPIVVAGARAGVCRSQGDVEALFRQGPAAETERKPKQISARLAAMMSGLPLASPPKVASAPAVPATEAGRSAVPQAALPATKAKPVAKAQTTKPDSAAKKAELPQKSPPKRAAKPPAKKAVKPTAKMAKKSKPLARTEKRM